MAKKKKKTHEMLKFLTTKKMQFKTKLRFHFTPVRKATTTNIKHKYWLGCGKKGILIHCW
jgi:hypothetical protein